MTKLRDVLAKMRNTVNTPTALQEFGLAAKAMQPTMSDPAISREDKRETLNAYVNTLSEKCFQNTLVGDQIVIIINMKEDVCKEYPDTQSQVDGIISWLPRMAYHKDKLVKSVAKNRKEYGLGV
jgi:hypothetical protein